MRWARTWYDPAEIPGIRNRPDSSVRALRVVPTRLT
jgi:hypothetical protein